MSTPVGGLVSDAYADRRSRAVEFLLVHGADRIEHLHSTLFEHLNGVERLLVEWGASEELSLAALCHATYGTDGFAPNLLDPSARRELVDAVGPDAEGIVYFYASCDRTVLYPQLGRLDAVSFRDRFSGETFPPEQAQLVDFVDLTVANELDIAMTSPGGPKEWTWLADFCEQVRSLATPQVFARAAEILGMVP